VSPASLHVLKRGIVCSLIIAGFGPAVSFGADSRRAPAEDGTAVLALVRDGPTSRFEPVLDELEKRLTELAGDDYTVRFVDKYQGDFSAPSVLAALRAALADPEIEIVYTAGPLVTELASRLSARERSKPVFGGFPELSESERLRIDAAGKSSIPNFTFAATPRRVLSDLVMLRRLARADRIDILIDEAVLSMLAKQEEQLINIEERVGIPIEMHGVTDDPAAALALLPADAEAVYVSVLSRLSGEGMTALFKGLEERGIFSFAMSGEAGLQQGAAAGLAAQMFGPLLRRTALSLNRLMLGAETNEIAVYLASRDQLVINQSVVDSLGWVPDYETLLEAQFVGPENKDGLQSLTLVQAMNLGASQNATARSQIHAAAIGRADARVAKSFLLPNLSLGLGHGLTHVTDRIDAASPDTLQAGTYGVTLQQILFDDEIWSGARAKARLADAAEFDAHSAVLDARAAAAIALLQYMRQSELLESDRENLRLGEGNRRLAGLRVDIGAADPVEIYRWVSEVAGARADLLQRISSRDNALISLNRIVGAPRTAQWNIAPIVLEDGEYFFMNEAMAAPMEERSSLHRLTSYFQTLATQNSPELASFDRTLTAQGIVVKQRKRAFFVPSVVLESGYDRAVSGADGIDTDGQNEWRVGVSLTYPLFEGLRRGAQVDRERAALRQLQALRDDATQRLEESALTAFNSLQADHADIRLSRRAAHAAKQNFDAVTEKYSQGAATVLDSLDAQAGLLSQRRRATNAAYDYLIDTINLQRSIAWFEATAGEGERAQWEAEMKAFLTTAPDSAAPDSAASETRQ
jgi:outer membrane protein